MANILKLKKQVETLLEECPATRDSDQYLTLKIWLKYYPEKLDLSDPANPRIAFKDIMILPREDNVKRIRAKLQNDQLKWLPTKLEVVKKRKINEVVWRARMGIPTFTKSMERHLEN